MKAISRTLLAVFMFWIGCPLLGAKPVPDQGKKEVILGTFPTNDGLANSGPVFPELTRVDASLVDAKTLRDAKPIAEISRTKYPRQPLSTVRLGLMGRVVDTLTSPFHRK